MIPGHNSLDYHVYKIESLLKTFYLFLTNLRENFKKDKLDKFQKLYNKRFSNIISIILILGLYNILVVEIENNIIKYVNKDDNDNDNNDILNIFFESIKDIINRLFYLIIKLRNLKTRLRLSRL